MKSDAIVHLSCEFRRRCMIPAWRSEALLKCLTSCVLEFRTLQFVKERGCVNRILDQTNLGSVISLIISWSKAHAYAWPKRLCVGPLSLVSCAGQPRIENGLICFAVREHICTVRST